MQRLRRFRSTTSSCPLIRSVTRDDGGTVSAEITRKGMSAYEQENLEAGTHIFYRDSDITITAVPNAGYRVQDWTINGQTTADTAVSKTLSNLQGEYRRFRFALSSW